MIRKSRRSRSIIALTKYSNRNFGWTDRWFLCTPDAEILLSEFIANLCHFLVCMATLYDLQLPFASALFCCIFNISVFCALYFAKNQCFNAISWLPGCLTLVVPPHSADSAAEDFLRLTQSFTLTFTF